MDRRRTQKEDMEAYLSGQLPYSKIKAFERQLEEDTSLQSEFNAYRVERAAMDLIAKEEYRKRFQKKTAVPEPEPALEEAGIDKKVIPLSSRLRPYLAIAASIALIAFIALNFLIEPTSPGNGLPDTPRAMALHVAGDYKLDELPSGVRKGPADEDTTAYQIRKKWALTQYNQYTADPATESDSYSPIIDSLSTLPAEQREDWVVYVLGQSYFKTGRYEDATAAFRQLAGKGAFGRRADGYLVLSLLALEQQDSEEFQTMMDKIIAEGEEIHSFYDEAVAIREALQD